jgi:hypothetical protein
MNKKFLLLPVFISGFALWLVLNGCSFVPGKDEPVDAHNEMAKIANMIFAGASSGDSTEIMEYMEEEEGGKVLKDLLIEDGISPEEITPKRVRYLDMPDFGNDVFHDGDILLHRDWNRFTSNLLDWLIPSLYTHTGVLDQRKFYRWMRKHRGEDPRDAPCVMSAVLEAGRPALTYQTWRDWASTSVVTRMRVADNEEYSNALSSNLRSAKRAFKQLYFPRDSTYGFVAPHRITGTETTILLPVPNDPDWQPNQEEPCQVELCGEKSPFGWLTFFGKPFGALEDPGAALGVFQNIGTRYWHCSKTAWWIYYKSGFTKGFYDPCGINPLNLEGLPDVENNDWYFRDGVDVKTFGFYKLYTALLLLGDEFHSEEDARAFAEESIRGAICMVAVPDEVRFATTKLGAGPLDENERRTWGPLGQRSEKLLKLF